MQEKRLICLDGLRGVAAFIVVIAHFEATMKWPNFASMLAVDLFFMISGFVIPYAYEAKLKGDMSGWRFTEVRFIRLYPLYILGVAINMARFVIEAPLMGKWLLKEPLKWLVPWAILLLPRPTLRRGEAFLLNPPAWSLFMEAIANALYVLALPWLSRRVLWAVVLFSAFALAVATRRFGGLDFGTAGYEMFWGLARTLCPFSIGALLHSYWRDGRLPLINVPGYVPPGLFVMTCFLPAGMTAWAVDVLLLPIIVVLAIGSRPGGAMKQLLAWSGDLSYPLYAIHMPIITTAGAVALMLGFSTRTGTMIGVPLAIVVAELAGRFYDPSARIVLAKFFNVRRKTIEAARAV